MCRNICGLPSVLFGDMYDSESLTRHLFPSLPSAAPQNLNLLCLCVRVVLSATGAQVKSGLRTSGSGRRRCT